MNILLAPSVLAVDIEHAELARRHGARLDNVELQFVGRERETVWALHIIGRHGDGAGLAVDAVDIGRQFRLVFSPS